MSYNNSDYKTGQKIGFKQQGGTMDAEQLELQYALIGYVMATKKLPKDQNEINQLAQALIQLKQQDPEKFNLLVQLGQQALQLQQATKAEKGAKLNYIKSLKGKCPDDEELVYFKKGGLIDCGCQKKEKGGDVEQPKKANTIEEFKKGRKTKKCLIGSSLNLSNPANTTHRKQITQTNYGNIVSDRMTGINGDFVERLILPNDNLKNDTVYYHLQLKQDPIVATTLDKDKTAYKLLQTLFNSMRPGKSKTETIDYRN